MNNKYWPLGCTHRLRAEGLAAPKSGCKVPYCRMGGMARTCPMLNVSVEPPEPVAEPHPADAARIKKLFGRLKEVE